MVELVNIKPRTPLLGRVGLPCRSHLRCSLICPRFSACPVAISRELSTKRIFEKSQSHVHVRKRQTTAPAASTVSDAITLLQESPLRDAGAFVFSIVGAKVLIKIFDKMEETGIIDRTLSRKLVHTLAGPLFVACWPLFSSASYAQFLAATVPGLNGLRLLLVGNKIIKDPRTIATMTRTGDPAELLRGPLYYVIVLLSVTAFYWRDSPVGIVIASLMCGGDGLADIFGRRFGASNPLPWNPEKSWAGSAAMFAGGVGTSLALVKYFSALGYINADFAVVALAVITIASVATLIESLPINQVLDDNLSVPGVAAVMGFMLLQVFVEVL